MERETTAALRRHLVVPENRTEGGCMKTIVCGTDFSGQARDAARVAAAWAQRARCPMRLIHVADATATFGLDAVGDALVGAQQQAIEECAADLRAEFGAEIQAVVATGQHYERIIAEANAHDAQLIVVGALGGRGSHGWSLGSTAERISQHATVPVLVVRDAPRLLDWIVGGQPLHALVCADMTRSSRGALAWSRQLHALGPCILELTYVAWPPGETDSDHAAVSSDSADPWESLRSGLARDLERWAGPVTDPRGERFHVLVNWGRADSALAQHAAANCSTLVVAGTHRRSTVARLWQGSVVRGLLHGAGTNIVTVPPRPGDASATFVVRRVLAAVDLGAMDRDVLRCAFGIAPPDGEVNLLHVIDRHASTETESEAHRRLQQLLEYRDSGRCAALHAEVRRATSPHLGIVEYAERMAADAICIGAKQRGTAADLLLGSQARALIGASRVPVVLVPVPAA
jgi:nucleotide-binding universal stress UspA family protein